MTEPGLNDDFRDLLRSLLECEVEFVIVGAHALAVHGVARATGDIDIFVRATPANAQRVVAALGIFGAPVRSHGVVAADFTRPDWVYQIGLPPRRIDLLTSISGVDFETAWTRRDTLVVDGLTLPFLGIGELRANKLASGRPKDLADIALLDDVT
ncbi:MAG: hypothetical protein H6697_12095 [Myxococcales bacterium]|nr:hypothetical protein [Myxococcales bacterium]